MKYLFINNIHLGTPYTWYKGFGFEEWEDGRPVRLYCAYYDGYKIAYVRVFYPHGTIAYGINDAGILVEDYYTPYHNGIIVETHKKYDNVYDKF